ncbi:jg1605 [Pararge aegeria aegeria]|uniref:1-phosphatidylinositol-5-phosphate 4-kinase n=1 Tax=Pararge aegeria aegeria TaxID=348720 RepID=A0A8S4RZU8_9NEOP|nr:jg1605 [Pararge aegeria aegeria]
MSVPSTGLSKLKKKHIRVKHQKVKLFRANEPLLSVFMWGVNHTINELSHVSIPVMLLPDDFRAYSKLKVDNHLFNKENMPSHFKVKEYCPLVFRNLRERFGIDDIDYKESLTRSQPIPDDSSGKSGAKFYQSYDRLFILKTLTSEEVERMHSFLKHYHPITKAGIYRGLLIIKLDSATKILHLCPTSKDEWLHLGPPTQKPARRKIFLLVRSSVSMGM